MGHCCSVIKKVLPSFFLIESHCLSCREQYFSVILSGAGKYGGFHLVNEYLRLLDHQGRKIKTDIIIQSRLPFNLFIVIRHSIFWLLNLADRREAGSIS